MLAVKNQETSIEEKIQCQKFQQSDNVFSESCKNVQKGLKPRCGGSWYGDSTSSMLSYEQVQWGEPHIYADTIGFRVAFAGQNLPMYLQS